MDMPFPKIRIQEGLLSAIQSCRPEISYVILDHAEDAVLHHMLANNGLLYACGFDHIFIVQALLDRAPGMDIDRGTCYRWEPHISPLSYAVVSGNIMLVQMLFEPGANPWGIQGLNREDVAGAKQYFSRIGNDQYNVENPMGCAAYYGEVDMAKLFIKAGLCYHRSVG
jgi:ankyrin repeat protein